MSSDSRAMPVERGVDHLGIGHEEMLARANALLPGFRQNRVRTERDRSARPENVEALRAAGLFRLFTPRRVGGYELSPRTMVDVVSTVAQSCSGTGWTLMVFTGHDWMLGMFPLQGQDEVYADGPDQRIAGVLAPMGQAEPVDGGWRVSGRWQFGSGADHAHWFLLGATLTTSTPERPRHVHVVVPRSQITIDDTWFTLGLRGSGSKDVLVDGAHVPAHRSVMTGALFGGRTPEAEQHETNLYLLPVTSGLAVLAAAAVLGIARSGYELFVEQVKTSRHKYTGERKAEKVGLQMRAAEAAAEIRVAELHLTDVCAQFEDLMQRGDRPDLDFRRRTKWQLVYAIEQCRRAVERLYAAAGARSVYDAEALQQVYRDINTASHHATVAFDDTAEMYGRVELGLSPGSVLI